MESSYRMSRAGAPFSKFLRRESTMTFHKSLFRQSTTTYTHHIIIPSWFCPKCQRRKLFRPPSCNPVATFRMSQGHEQISIPGPTEMGRRVSVRDGR
jgi:hypothetical protein